MGKSDIKKEGFSSAAGVGEALIPQKLVGMENKMKKKTVKKGKCEHQPYLNFLESDEIKNHLMKAKPKNDGELKDAMDIIKSNVKIVKKNNKVSKSRLISELLSVQKAEEGSKKMIFGHPFTLKGGKWTPDDGGIPDKKASKPKGDSAPKSGGKDLIDAHPLRSDIKEKLRTPEGTKLLNKFKFNLSNKNKEAARRAHSQLEKLVGNTGAKYNEAQSDYLWNLGESMVASKKK